MIKNSPDFIQSVGRIGNQFPQENLFVRVEGVDDKTHQLSNLSLDIRQCYHMDALFILKPKLT